MCLYLSDKEEFRENFFSKFFQGTKRLVNQFLLFKYSCVYISVTKRNSEKIFNFVEGAWLALACVQVSKLQSFHGARKSPLNIEKIEFC